MRRARPGGVARLGLTTGFSTDPLLIGANAASRATWIPKAVSEGAQGRRWK